MGSLRNRRLASGYQYATEALIPVDQSYINQRAEREALIENVRAYISALKNNGTDANVINELQKIIHNPTHLNDLLNNPPFQKMVTAAREAARLRSAQQQDGSVLMSLANGMLEALRVSGYVTPVGLVLGAVQYGPSIAAAAVQYISGTGVPSGASSQCSGQLFGIGCAEGWVQAASSTTFDPATDQQTQRYVFQSTGGSKQESTTTYETLRTCMTVPAMNTDVISVLQSAPSNGANLTLTCSAQSNVWLNYQVTSTVTNLTPAQCALYKNAFAVRSSGCESTVAELKETGIIVGCTLAAACVLAVCVGAACFVNKRCVDQDSNYSFGMS